VKLSELKVGEKGYIVKVSGYGGFRRRIVEMGFIKGKEVEVIQNAPLLDPIKYKIMGYEVSVRRNVAAQIDVIKTDEAEKFLSEELCNDFHGTFSEEDFRRVALKKRREINIALVGNPNSGKSTLFNTVTGQHAKVGNYSGVTVETKKGNLIYNEYNFTIVDLPGTYSISAFSPEERLVREYIIKEQPDIIINVLDANNLERNMFLTTQLIDMNVRTVIALNFYDELQNRGDKIDCEVLEQLIGIPIVPTVSTKGVGLDKLFDTAIKLYEGSDIIDKEGKLIEAIEDDELIEKYHHLIHLEHKHNKNHNLDLSDNFHLHQIVRHIHINYGSNIERAIEKLKTVYSVNEDAYDDFTPRYIAIQLLSHDKEIEGFAAKYSNFSKIIKIRDDEEKLIESDLKTTAANAIIDAKYGFIAGALKETFIPAKEKKNKTVTSRIDSIVTNKFLAYPVLLLIIFLMFGATFALGKYPMGWIEWGVAKIGDFVRSIMNEGMLQDLIVDGIIGGVGSVIVFLPNIIILYFCMTLLDASGYMARAVFIMDKLMHKIGLHGRSFIPLMMGFGCNVPAIMATRTIENRNSRMITIMVSSLIPCLTRIQIFTLLIGTLFSEPLYQTLVMFGIYLFSIMLVAILAKIFKKFLFFREETLFVMELPTYRLPSIKYLARETWEKGSQYVKKIGSIILIGSAIIWALNYFPLGNAESQTQDSYLETVGKTIEPAMKPLGFDWKISVALLTGAAAKEMVISTLNVLNDMEEDAKKEELQKKLREKYPDGSRVFSVAAAISLILFVLIYFPCIATIATIKQETQSWKWALFVAFYTIVLAWIISFVAYNVISAKLFQETVVALIILACLIVGINRILKIKSSKNRCENCTKHCIPLQGL
jgi:ferrous iron transport protein B